MLAVIKTGGKQYKVQAGDSIKVEKIEAEEGSQVQFDQVMLWSDGETVKIGDPVVKGALVEATVIKQGKAEKVTSIKHHPKKRYLKKQGHRQFFTQVKVDKILLK